jgi:hypothetical protein
MLAEFLVKLREFAAVANVPKIVTCDSMPEKVFVAHNGRFEEHARSRKPINGSLVSFESFVEYATSVFDSCELYVDCSGVYLVLDIEDRWELMSMDFQYSSRFVKLMQLGDRGYSPAQAIRCLQFNLELQNQGVINSLRKINFQRRSDGASTVQHGKESLGKSVEAKVQQAEDVPESFVVNTPVFINPGFRFEATVDVGLFLDLDEECIRFVPSADGIEMARFSAVNQTIAHLRTALGDGPKVYHGSPGE